jgi:hypothetical protein
MDKTNKNKILRHLMSDVRGAGRQLLDFGEVARRP